MGSQVVVLLIGPVTSYLHLIAFIDFDDECVCVSVEIEIDLSLKSTTDQGLRNQYRVFGKEFRVFSANKNSSKRGAIVDVDVSVWM